jgi:hypothetical protein
MAYSFQAAEIGIGRRIYLYREATRAHDTNFAIPSRIGTSFIRTIHHYIGLRICPIKPVTLNTRTLNITLSLFLPCPCLSGPWPHALFLPSIYPFTRPCSDPSGHGPGPMDFAFYPC